MGVFITALGSMIINLVTKLFLNYSRYTFAIAYLGSFTILTMVFMFTINGALPGLISSSSPGGLVAAGLSLIPSNIPSCIAIVGAGHMARWVFMWQAKFISSLMRP